MFLEVTLFNYFGNCLICMFLSTYSESASMFSAIDRSEIYLGQNRNVCLFLINSLIYLITNSNHIKS